MWASSFFFSFSSGFLLSACFSACLSLNPSRSVFPSYQLFTQPFTSFRSHSHCSHNETKMPYETNVYGPRVNECTKHLLNRSASRAELIHVPACVNFDFPGLLNPLKRGAGGAVEAGEKYCLFPPWTLTFASIPLAAIRLRRQPGPLPALPPLASSPATPTPCSVLPRKAAPKHKHQFSSI